MDLTRIVLPGMLERGRGHIVNMASLAGKVPPAYLASYAATKHGVVGFTHALRAENGDEPVGFSAICPGFVSRVGMFGRLEHLVSAPRFLGTVPPESRRRRGGAGHPQEPGRGDRQQAARSGRSSC